MAKQMMFSQEARQQILEGLSKLANAVKITMGPTGRNVIMQKSFGAPRVTKEGVSVSKEIELPQPFENMGAKLINQVASKTSDAVGDGTTAATVLAEAIFREGYKTVSAGASPMAVKRGIDRATHIVRPRNIACQRQRLTAQFAHFIRGFRYFPFRPRNCGDIAPLRGKRQGDEVAQVTE